MNSRTCFWCSALFARSSWSVLVRINCLDNFGGSNLCVSFHDQNAEYVTCLLSVFHQYFICFGLFWSFFLLLEEQTTHLANVMPEMQQCERNFNEAIEKKDYDAGMDSNIFAYWNSVKNLNFIFVFFSIETSTRVHGKFDQGAQKSSSFAYAALGPGTWKRICYLLD